MNFKNIAEFQNFVMSLMLLLMILLTSHQQYPSPAIQLCFSYLIYMCMYILIIFRAKLLFWRLINWMPDNQELTWTLFLVNIFQKKMKRCTQWWRKKSNAVHQTKITRKYISRNHEILFVSLTLPCFQVVRIKSVLKSFNYT